MELVFHVLIFALCYLLIPQFGSYPIFFGIGLAACVHAICGIVKNGDGSDLVYMPMFYIGLIVIIITVIAFVLS